MSRRRVMEADRVSNLPQHIIENILSGMLLKDAIRTSVLSSTWRHIWASRPVLLLDTQFYTENFDRETEFHKESIERFVDSVSKILSLHVGVIRKLELYVPKTRDFDISPSVDQWINGNLCDCEFTLLNWIPHPYKLPYHFFEYCKLTHLQLSNCILEPPHGFRGFPNLTRLSLQQVIFPASCTFEVLLPSAEFLEYLSLNGCGGVINMRVDAPRLHKLLVGSVVGSVEEYALSFGLFGRTPNLTVVLLPGADTLQKDGNAANLTKLLSSMPKVSSLWLLGSILVLLTSAGTIPESLPTPLNLTYLSIGGLALGELDQLSSVLCILISSPKLRGLKVGYSRRRNVAEEEAAVYLTRPRCLEHPLDQLQTIELTDLRASRVVHAFIKLLLAKTPLLRKMTIRWRAGTNVHAASRCLSVIARLHRVSTTPAEELFVMEANPS